MLVTSYFAKVKELTAQGYVIINIARGCPKEGDFIRYPKLQPTQALLSEYKAGNITDEQYTKIYQRTILARLSAYQTCKDLLALSNNNNKIALCCFESSEKFCHRHVIANWLNANGIKCVEYK